MHKDIQRAQQAIDDAILGVSGEQLAWHREGKWSAADILEHLSLTYSGSATLLERCLRDGGLSTNAPTWSQRLKIFVVTMLHYMPTGWRAPDMVTPRGSRPEIVIADLRKHLFAADEAIRRCEARFGSATRIANHPLLGPLTASQWRIFHVVHTQHHVNQIIRLIFISSNEAKLEMEKIAEGSSKL